MNYQNAIKTIKSNYPDSRYGMLREALDLAIQLLENADKYKWHDLRKDPSDLPVKQGMILAWVLPPTKQYLFRSLKLVYFTDLMGICKSCHFHNGMVGESDFEKYDGRVIAWKYIEPFEVEE